MVLTSPAGQTSPVKAAAMNVAAPRAVLGRLGQGGAPGPRARRPDGTLTRAREGGQGLAGLQDGEGRGLVHPSGSTWRLKCSVFPLTRGQDPADAAALSRRLFRGEGSGERLTVGGAGPADTPGWHGGAPSLRRRHRGASGGRGGGDSGRDLQEQEGPNRLPLDPARAQLELGAPVPLAATERTERARGRSEFKSPSLGQGLPAPEGPTPESHPRRRCRRLPSFRAPEPGRAGPRACLSQNRGWGCPPKLRCGCVTRPVLDRAWRLRVRSGR